MVSEAMRILALDFGRKRVGVAISRSGQLAEPLTVLTLTSQSNFLKELSGLIEQEAIEQIVVGHGITQPALTPWLNALNTSLNIPVIVADETASTEEAQARVGSTKNHADATAAQIILEHYLEDLCYNKNQSESKL